MSARSDTIDIGALGERLAEVLANPAANLTAAFLLFAAAVLVGLMVIIVVALRVVAARSAEEGARPDARGGAVLAGARAERGRARRGRGARAAVSIVVLALVTAALYVAAGYSGSTRICYRECHRDVAAHVTDGNTVDAHRTAPCVQCHEGPLGSRLAALPERAAHIVRASAGGRPEYPPMGSHGCLTCHRALLAATTRSSDLPITMSHAEPVARGMGCEVCHAVGHDESAKPRKGRMNTCLVCHDGQAASSACSVCHIGDASAVRTARNEGRLMGRVQPAARIECGGCHDLRPCDACHGLRMPHSREFEEGGHAPVAAFERKELCFRQCHEPVECTMCHGDFASHGPGFKERHGQGQPFTAPCSCHAPANDPTRPFCPVCHERDPRR